MYHIPEKREHCGNTLLPLPNHTHRSPEAELRPFEIPCFFSYNPESLALHVQSIGVSALAVDCFFIRFYIVNALHQRESEIRQEFNLSSDQAQRFIQRTSDVMKELKYIAENRLSAENGVLSRVDETQTDVPAFEPLFADSDCSAMSNTWRGSLESLAWFMRYWRDNFSAAYDLNRVFLIGSDNLCMANFGLRDMPVERDTALKALHERINKYRNAPQDDSGSNLYWISEGPRPGVGYFTP